MESLTIKPLGPISEQYIMLSDYHVARHNEEAQAVWAAYRAGKPTRVPVMLYADMSFYLANEDVNPGRQVSFQRYSEDPSVMMDLQLRAAEWYHHHIALHCDETIGLPDTFSVRVDMQNYFEAGYFGAAVEYRPGQVPDTRPILDGDRKNLLFHQGLPDPLTGGIFAKAHDSHEAMLLRLHGGFAYRGRPVGIAPFGLATDGPLTVALSLRGVELFTDFYTDVDYVRQLLDFVVQATVARIRAHRRLFGLPEVSDSWHYADDAVAMLSTEMVREFVLPAHRALKGALTTADRIRIHLCGDSTRHFRLLRDALGVYSFDTGFPVDFAWLRAQVGPEVEILGGPRAPLLLNGTPDQVRTETESILQSGIMQGGRFILREGNCLAPGTPLGNLEAMYDAARKFGRY